MSERTWLGAMVIGVAALAVPTGLGAAEPEPKAVAPLILNLMNRPVESRERAYTEDIKRDALAPRPSGVDEWEPQPDGSIILVGNLTLRPDFGITSHGKLSAYDCINRNCYGLIPRPCASHQEGLALRGQLEAAGIGPRKMPDAVPLR